MSVADREEGRVPSQERAVRTRAALVLSAKNEFSERGYAGATAKSIADRAGVSTGSFYQYFRDKDQVLAELAAERYGRVRELVTGLLASDSLVAHAPDEAELRDRMRELVGIVIAFHREDPRLHAVLTECRHADQRLDEMTSEAESGLVALIARLLRALGRGGDVEALSFVLFGMVEGSTHAHVLGTPVVDDARLVDALVGAMVTLTTRG